MIIFAKNLPKLMTKFRYFSLAFCLLLALPAWSQFETKLLEFPEYGFKIPFFKSATRTVYDAGKPEERIEYAFSYTQKGKLFAFLRIYPRAGCYRADSLYAQYERFTRQYEDKPTTFRILTSNGNTYPFGWSGYTATAVIDGPRSTPVATRDIQAFTNGKVMFSVDVISQEFNFSNETKPILEDPGYNSIFLPHNFTELNLRIFTRGNVSSQYVPSEKKYYVGRCDKLGSLYPYATFERLGADPASSALGLLGEARQTSGVSDAKVEEFAPEGQFSRMTGKVYKVSFRQKASDADGRMIHYCFTFNNSHYRASLVVPFVKDDGKVYSYQDNEFTESSVPLFDERLREMMGSVERIR